MIPSQFPCCECCNFLCSSSMLQSITDMICCSYPDNFQSLWYPASIMRDQKPLALTSCHQSVHRELSIAWESVNHSTWYTRKGKWHSWDNLQVHRSTHYEVLIRHFEKYLNTMKLKLTKHVGITTFLLYKQKNPVKFWYSELFYSEILNFCLFFAKKITIFRFGMLFMTS